MDDVELDDATGWGDGTSFRQPRASISAQVSPFSRMRWSATSRGRKGPTGLVGVANAGIVGVHQHLGDHARDRPPRLGAELVPERLLDHVADLPLRLGSAHVERHRGHQRAPPPRSGSRDSRPGAIAVREDRLIALGDELDDLTAGATDVLELLLVAAELLRAQDGVATERHHDPLLATRAPLPKAGTMCSPNRCIEASTRSCPR